MLAHCLRRLIPERFRPIGYLTHLAQKRTGNRVAKGPFTGTRYIGHAHGSAYIPKLLGIYERELSSQIEVLIQQVPDLIVDIGAAEGYYAIGLARRLPHSSIVAFEMDSQARTALLEMAELNGVQERVRVCGKCVPPDLETALSNSQHPAIICDVEGDELLLLDPDRAPTLKRSMILVELHEFLIPNITQTLKTRFSTSHHITHVWQTRRSHTEFPWTTLGTRLLPKPYLDWAVSEWRPERMSWLWMQPTQGAFHE